MQDHDEALKKMRAGSFRENNGRVIRTINILRHEYVRLRDVCFALTDVTPGEVLDSVNFLQMAHYIQLRHIETKAPVADMADAVFNELEAKVTVEGIRLLSGSINDADVIV